MAAKRLTRVKAKTIVQLTARVLSRAICYHRVRRFAFNPLTLFPPHLPLLAFRWIRVRARSPWRSTSFQNFTRISSQRVFIRGGVLLAWRSTFPITRGSVYYTCVHTETRDACLVSTGARSHGKPSCGVVGGRQSHLRRNTRLPPSPRSTEPILEAP